MRIVGVNQKTGDIFIQRGVKTEHHIKNITASSAKRLHYILDKYGEQNVAYLGGSIRTYYFEDFYFQPIQNHSALKEIDRILLEASADSMLYDYPESIKILRYAIYSVRNLIAKELDENHHQ